MLLTANLVLIGLIVATLWAATRRSRRRAKRAGATRGLAALVDLIPGRSLPPPTRVVRRDPQIPATWSASLERGETAPPVPVVEPVASTNGKRAPARPPVLVLPRGSSWVVRRDGASRASSVHATRAAAEERARKTASRERVVLEVRDGASAVLDRIDFSMRSDATP